jgi:hypothetical protein
MVGLGGLGLYQELSVNELADILEYQRKGLYFIDFFVTML